MSASSKHGTAIPVKRPDAPLFTLPVEWPLWIDGRPEPGAAHSLIDVTNPATGETLCQVAEGRGTDIDRAVQAATRALPAWAELPPATRARLLFELAEALREIGDEVAWLETMNNGMPLREASVDVEKSAQAFEFYAGYADKLFGKTIPVSGQFLNYTVREPIGVTAHIAPWNYPLRLAVRSLAPALAAGNTVVLKPAELTPLTALRLAQLTADVGLPPGVVNVVPGLGPEAGAALASHPDINHIAFTGSVETGIEVMQRAARNVVPVTLELGGKSPNIVFADADLGAALDGTIKAIFSNAGQVCCAGSRLLLQDRVYDQFVDALVDRTREIEVGPGIDDPDMGPLITAEQQQRVLAYIGLGEEEGGEILTGGRAPADPRCTAGNFVEPTLLAGVSQSARVAQDEIFGPVLTIFRFSDEDTALATANDSPYGLVAGIWTTNLDRAHKLAANIKAGQIYINDFFSGSIASPFGGYKRSGFGRERGVEAFDHYTQTKSVCIRFGA